MNKLLSDKEMKKLAEEYELFSIEYEAKHEELKQKRDDGKNK